MAPSVERNELVVCGATLRPSDCALPHSLKPFWVTVAPCRRPNGVTRPWAGANTGTR